MLFIFIDFILINFRDFMSFLRFYSKSHRLFIFHKKRSIDESKLCSLVFSTKGSFIL
jgi:hypothetical protein